MVKSGLVAIDMQDAFSLQIKVDSLCLGPVKEMLSCLNRKFCCSNCIFLVLRDRGNELRKPREFVPAFEWLFGQSSTSTREFSTPEIKFILHTKESNIQLLAPDTTQHYEFNVISLSGRIVYTGSFREFTQFSSSSWANGLYVVNIMRGGNLVWTSKFAVSH